jgi:hypothetical protein
VAHSKSTQQRTADAPLFQLGEVIFSVAHKDPRFANLLQQLLPVCDEGKRKQAHFDVNLGWETNIDKLLDKLLEQMEARSTRIAGASLVTPGGAKILVTGAAGSGKTVLALTLVIKHGWKLLSEHCTFLAMDRNEIRSFPAPPKMNSGTRKSLEEAGVTFAPFILHNYIPISAELWRSALHGPFDALFYLQKDFAGAVRTDRIPAAQLVRMAVPISNLMMAPSEFFDRFMEYLPSNDCFQLAGGGLIERCDRLRELCVPLSSVGANNDVRFENETSGSKAIIDLEQGAGQRTFSWITDTVMVAPKRMRAGLELNDNLLVSIGGSVAAKQRELDHLPGGLLAINRGTDSSIHIIDRLPTCGLWLDHRSLIRALNHEQLVLHQYKPEGVRIIANAQCRFTHDVRLEFGQLLAVSTGTNEVVQLSMTGEIVRSWKFPGEPGSRHLNCIDLWDGRYVVSCFGRFTETDKMKEKLKGAGIIFDLETDTTVWDGLYCPHTPRTDGNRQFICDSGAERLLMREKGNEKIHEVVFPHSFPRGLAFGEQHIYVGLSAIRDFIRGKECTSIPNARIAILDRETLSELDQFDVPGLEIYDIIVAANDQREALFPQ